MAEGGEPPPLRPPEHQVAGHRASAGQMGPLVDGAGRFYKPLQSGGRGDDELAFYSSFWSHPSIPDRIRKAFFPAFHGTVLLPSPALTSPPSPAALHPHLVLDDLLSGLVRPSVMDIKIGARTWPPSSPEDYVAKCLAKDRGSTSLHLGFRVSGVRVAATGEVWRIGRADLKRLDAIGVRLLLRRFVSSNAALDANPDCALAAAVYGSVLRQLLELKAWFEEQTLFHFYSASVLVAYDAAAAASPAASGNADVRVKLVDFAHVVDSEGVIDHNFLGGLCSLIKFVFDVMAEAEAAGDGAEEAPLARS